MTNDELYDELMEIDFFKEGIHPEYTPFIGEDFHKFRILHIGESHYIPNYPEENRITLDDFDGWWSGEQSESLNAEKGWFNTRQVVSDYMDGSRTKAHGIFTNTLKSFCKVVTPGEAFDSISIENSKKYNYFAYMNFYQQPSIYHGMNFTRPLYLAGEYLNWDSETIDEMWYKIFDESVRIVENVIEILEPQAVVITSNEIYEYYRDYGSANEKNQRVAGKLIDDDRMIWVDHPGSPWWNRAKNDEQTSKMKFEDSLRKIYCE